VTPVDKTNPGAEIEVPSLEFSGEFSGVDQKLIKHRALENVSYGIYERKVVGRIGLEPITN
jgi:hypothetical protein